VRTSSACSSNWESSKIPGQRSAITSGVDRDGSLNDLPEMSVGRRRRRCFDLHSWAARADRVMACAFWIASFRPTGVPRVASLDRLHEEGRRQASEYVSLHSRSRVELGIDETASGETHVFVEGDCMRVGRHFQGVESHRP
jgi:hypothetical protein